MTDADPQGPAVVISAVTGQTYDTDGAGISDAVGQAVQDDKLFELQLLQAAAQEAAAQERPRTDPNDPFDAPVN